MDRGSIDRSELYWGVVRPYPEMDRSLGLGKVYRSLRLF